MARSKLIQELRRGGQTKESAALLVADYAHQLAVELRETGHREAADLIDPRAGECTCGSPTGDDEDSEQTRRYWHHARSCPLGTAA
ncbi:hypothetical protein G3I40_45870 [Streptomyces sp. SID14478]|uniref:hypothetical protein n=1 Tax=Streptomyces sp. SID14478 TaxID=2706073 RepID=UPI0013DEC172|nr:hypothetical protein [Streptomyces sp. SID14478]NEB82490.1 hypothetical protein [Streptomyces sp. SID14478]